jgi:hypothetical protein
MQLAGHTWNQYGIKNEETEDHPGIWQHSLPACSLALAGWDLHPLDSNKKSHRLIFGSSSSKLSQRDDNTGGLVWFLGVLSIDEEPLPIRRHVVCEELFRSDPELNLIESEPILRAGEIRPGLLLPHVNSRRDLTSTAH